MTIGEAISEGAAILDRAHLSEARRTVGVLLGAVLGLDRAQLIIQQNQPLDETARLSFFDFINRRAAGEPLQYIIGHQEFFGLDFIVTPAVLIPRPETEFLVERALAALDGIENPLVVDIGTGSGCIAVALATRLPQARFIATDISPEALAVARENAARHGVDSRIEFLIGDLLDPLAGRGLEGQIDLLASNPPYIATKEAGGLQREVRDWEPHVALFGGEGGFENYRRLLDGAARFLKPGGVMLLEIGYRQLDHLQAMVEAAGWRLEDVTADLQGFPRTLTIRKA